MSAPRWLLELQVGGQVLRLASIAGDITDAAGDTYAYDGGLRVGAVSLLSDSIALSALAPATGPSWAARASRGASYERRPGTLRLWREGDTLEDAQVVMRGLVEFGAYGGRGEPLQLTLSRAIAPRATEIPDARAICQDGVTWPVNGSATMDDTAEGQRYPVVFGFPGAGRGDVWPAYPVPFVQRNASGDSHWLVGDGQDLAATEVEIFRIMTDGTSPSISSADRAIIHAVDAIGRRVSIAQQVAGLATQDVEYWCGHPKTTGGGKLNRNGSAAARGAGEVLERLLRDYTDADLDIGRMRAVEPVLDAYKLDFAINDSINVWELIDRAILPLLPVRARVSAEGLYFQLVQYRGASTDAVAHLDADRQVIRRTSPLQSRYETYNRFTIDFAKHREGFAQMLVLTGDPEANRILQWTGESADSRVIGDYRCRVSQSRYGILTHEPIQTAMLWSRSSAQQVLHDRADKHAIPLLGAQYTGDGLLARKVDIGDLVLITDSEIEWAEQLCVIDDMAVGVNETVLELTALPSL